jgi:hypothetical protein
MKRAGGRKNVGWVAVVVLALVPVVAPAGATEVKTFQLQSQKAFLAGTLEGISVDPLGRLELADRVERVTALAEPFLFSAARHPEGWVVGTGNEGRVLLVTRDGETRELFAAPEGQVFAVAADDDGTVWAGASPGGKVYRIGSGGADGGQAAGVWFETGETYVWDLARAADGSLLVATGTSGKVFRVTGEGEGAELYDTGDTHARSLAPLPGGDVLVGTAGEGLVLRVGADGTARTLYDAAQPEVVALSPGADGSFYAAAIASEASAVDLSGASAGAAPGGASPGDSEGGTVTVEVTPGGASAGSSSGSSDGGSSGAVGSRPSSFRGKRAEVLSVSGAGVVETVGSFDEETVFDLLWEGGRLWIATGLEGKLYSFDGERMVLEKDLDERQVVALLPGDAGPAFATTNAPAIYRVTPEKERTGTYTSPALDAGAVSRFGTLRFRGRVPRGAELAFSFRSGVSSDPDRTWSEWTEPRAPSEGGEVALDGLPRGRYVQWRARLESGRGEVSPRLDSVELTYRQENLRPRVTSFTVLDPGEILVPAGFNPTQQVFEPVSPNRDGIFTTLDDGSSAAEGRTKTLWKKGWRSLQWEVEDPNEDELVYSLHFRRGDEGAEGGWLPVVEELEDTSFGFDATALPDGLYRFRLVASDAAENAPGEGLVGEELSEPVVIDHSPPALVEAGRTRGGEGGGTLRVVVEDAWNPLRSAEVSVDATGFEPAPAADGLLDGRREALELAVPEGAKLLLLRLTDAAFNTVTFDLSDRLP